MKLIAKEKIIVELWDGRMDGALAQVRYELSINYELKGGSHLVKVGIGRHKRRVCH